MTKRFSVFVLTLEGDDQRRAPLLAELRKQNIDFELFFGIDGRGGLSADHEAMVDRPKAEYVMRRILSDGEYACALSHRAIYEKILADNLDAALILEDDALISPRLGDFLQAQGAWQHPMILLDYSRVSVGRWSNRIFGNFGQFWRVVDKTYFATGYIVSRKAAQYLLSVTTPIQSVADWPGDLYDAKAYILSPRLVDHLPIGNPLSHLHQGRKKTGSKARKRYLTYAYWRCYLRHRLSRRINP